MIDIVQRAQSVRFEKTISFRQIIRHLKRQITIKNGTRKQAIEDKRLECQGRTLSRMNQQLTRATSNGLCAPPNPWSCQESISTQLHNFGIV